MPTIYIDDQAYEVPEGENVLEACLSAGLDLPYFCWHPEMGSIGACRQCALVQFRDEEDTQGRIVMGCMTPVAEGARFSMKGRDATEFRNNIIESLMLNHPHDCPVCAEGGECHLQDMTVMVGHRNRSYRGKKNTHKNQNLGPLIHHEMNRCITCYRCTRFYNDYAGGTDLAAQAAHDHVYFGRMEDGTLESEFAGNLVEVCPTGVFTDKPLVNEYTRKWDLQSAPSVCTGCALGCNTSVGERYGKLKRIHNRFNHDVNGYFLCDRGRYGGNYVNDEARPQFAGLRQEDGRYNAIDQSDAIEKLSAFVGNGKVAGIGSPRASIESNYLLRKLVGSENFVSGMADDEFTLADSVLNTMQNGGLQSPSMRDIEAADAVLILGEDVTNTAPRMALSLRQSVRNRAKAMAAEMRIPEWQDEAVRNLAQDKLNPLFILSAADSRLDDIAEQTATLAPQDIARAGFAIATQLQDSATSIEGFGPQIKGLIQRISDCLKAAQRPLIVSGTGLMSKPVLDAATAIASALKNPQAMLSFCLPEANTLGSVLLADESQPDLSELSRRASAGEIDTLLVLENDLFRRAPAQQVNKLLADVPNVVVMDVTATQTMSQASLALPTASFAEAEGTVISSEGRAQRHYPVFLPVEQRQAAWQWLNDLAKATGKVSYEHFDELMQACEYDVASLSGIAEASPSSAHRSRGVKIPRQTHRYSGRTAMLADVSVHEPKQPQDKETPLAFTMEGDNHNQSGALLPFVWSPGWNSNQSIHKFQSEVGGRISGGTAGKRLIERGEEIRGGSFEVPAPSRLETGQWQLVPLYRIFGSDELSALSPAVNELISEPFIELCSADAASINAEDGDKLTIHLGDEDCELSLSVNDSIPAGCAGYSVGLPGMPWVSAGSTTSLSVSKKEGQ